MPCARRSQNNTGNGQLIRAACTQGWALTCVGFSTQDGAVPPRKNCCNYREQSWQQGNTEGIRAASPAVPRKVRCASHCPLFLAMQSAEGLARNCPQVCRSPAFKRLPSLWNRHREQSRDADLDAVQHGCTIPNSGDGIEAVDNHDLRLAGDVVPELPRPVVVRAAGKAGKMKRPPPQAGASAHLLCTIACRGPCSERGKLTSSSRRRIECNAAAATNRGVNVRSAFALPTAWPTTQPRTSADPSLI